MMKVLFLLSFLISFVFANVSLLSSEQRSGLLDFINSNASFIKLDNGLIIRNNNYVNLNDGNLSHVSELTISNPYITTLIDELGYMSSLNKFYFSEATLVNNQIPSTFYMLDVNYSSTPDGTLKARTTYSGETTNEFFDRLGWFRANQPPQIDMNINKTFIQKNNAITIDIEASDSDGYLRNYSCDFGDGYVYPSLLVNILEQDISESINHIYYDNGIYDVNCSVKDDNNKTSFEISKVYVSNTPIKAYSLYPKKENNTFKVNQDIYFDLDLEDNETFTYSWNFGDSIGVDITERNPTYKFSKAGTYSVTCKVTDSTNEVIYGYLTTIIEVSDIYDEIMNGEDGLAKNIFETTSEWQSRIDNFSKDVKINIVLNSYDSDNEEVTFSYDLSEYYIDDTHTTTQYLAREDSKYVYENLVDEDNVTIAIATLKAKIENNKIKLYPDNFFFEGTTKECQYFNHEDLNVLIDEFKKAEYENTNSHKSILKKFNDANKLFCFGLNFITYNTEDKRLYADINLSDINLTNQEVMIDIESKDRGKNIEHFKNSMVIETPFNVIYDDGEYRIVLEENLSIIHPSVFYDDFYFIDTNITSDYLNSLKEILKRGDIDYESYSDWYNRVNNFERDIILNPQKNGFNYDTINKKLELSLDLTNLNNSITFYQISVATQIEAREVYDSAKAIVELRGKLESGLIKFEINEVKFRLNTKEYIATEVNTTEPEGQSESTYLSIAKGWNLLAIPIQKTVKDLSVLGNFKDIWVYDYSIWSHPTSITSERGFWLNSNESGSVYFYGVRYIPNLTFSSSGWYLVGTGKEINLSDVTQNIVWVYRNGEWLSKDGGLTKINSGEGFWVKNP